MKLLLCITALLAGTSLVLSSSSNAVKPLREYSKRAVIIPGPSTDHYIPLDVQKYLKLMKDVTKLKDEMNEVDRFMNDVTKLKGEMNAMVGFKRDVTKLKNEMYEVAGFKRDVTKIKDEMNEVVGFKKEVTKIKDEMNEIVEVKKDVTKLKDEMKEVVGLKKKLMQLEGELKHVESGLILCGNKGLFTGRGNIPDTHGRDITSNHNTRDIRVWFKKSYNKPPVISFGLMQLDNNSVRTNTRISNNVVSVTNTGFTFRCGTWHNTHIFKLGFSWTSIPQ